MTAKLFKSSHNSQDSVTTDLRPTKASVYHFYHYQYQHQSEPNGTGNSLATCHFHSHHSKFGRNALTTIVRSQHLDTHTHAILFIYGINTNHRNTVTPHPRGTRLNSDFLYLSTRPLLLASLSALRERSSTSVSVCLRSASRYTASNRFDLAHRNVSDVAVPDLEPRPPHPSNEHNRKS